MNNFKTVMLIVFASVFYQCDAFFLQIGDWDSPKQVDLDMITTHKQPRSNPTQEIHQLLLEGPSGLQVPCTFFNRQSDTMLIVGCPLPAPKEAMELFATLFDTYDVVLFDYQWSGCFGSMLTKAIVTARPIQKILFDQIAVVERVLSFAQERKQYTKIVGLGECYSAFFFAKIQADAIKKTGTGPFTHLIFDSCWHSIRSFAEQICVDPFLPINPKKGGAPRLLTMLTNSTIFKKTVLRLAFAMLQNVSIEPYISSVKTPLLFIHGLNDLFVTKAHFDTIWDAADPHNRAVLYTPYGHCDNLHKKDVYRSVCNTFINAASIKELQNLPILIDA